MNALPLTALTVGSLLVSTLPNLAQEIRTPFGALHMGMSIIEAELALGAKSYSTDRGAIFIESNFNGQTYLVSFDCPDRNSRCGKEAMKPRFIEASYTNEIISDLRPREATEILKNFSFDGVKAQYYENCAKLNIKKTIIIAGRICGNWGIRMRYWRAFPDGFGFGGFTPCTDSCF
jgi:hypothetical protein